MARNNLEERLITFAVDVLYVAETMIRSFAGNYYSEQITRSSASAALNYGEAESAESRKDFIHKMKVVLKELRETHVNLKIIYRANLNPNQEKVNNLIKENNELISIFVKSVQTARNNLQSMK